MIFYSILCLNIVFGIHDTCKLSISQFFFDDLAALFFDDLAALFFDDFTGVFLAADFTGVFLAADFTGVFLAADLTGVFLDADLTADFLELFAICLVFVPCLASDGFAALFLTADLTGVETGAGVEATTGATGFDALLIGVDAFFADCLVADFFVAD
jgi:hypothetical protein